MGTTLFWALVLLNAQLHQHQPPRGKRPTTATKAKPLAHAAETHPREPAAPVVAPMRSAHAEPLEAVPPPTADTAPTANLTRSPEPIAVTAKPASLLLLATETIVLGRNFSFRHDLFGATSNHRQPLIVAFGARAHLFPFAHTANPWWRGLGIEAQFFHSLTAEATAQARHTTWAVSAALRYQLELSRVTLWGSVGGGTHQASLSATDSAAGLLRRATYGHLRPQLGVRLS